MLVPAARTQDDGHLHLQAVEELQLGARAVPGGVHPERVGRPLLLEALVERLGAQIRLEVHLHGHSARVTHWLYHAAKLICKQYRSSNSLLRSTGRM